MKVKPVDISYDPRLNKVNIVDLKPGQEGGGVKTEDSLSGQKIQQGEPKPQEPAPADPDPKGSEPQEPKGQDGPQDPPTPEPQEPQLSDDIVLSYLREKGLEVESFEDLQREEGPKEPEYPEAVKKFMEYHEETGRGFEDFVKLNRDFEKMDPEQLLIEYTMEENPGFTQQDALEHLDDMFGYDEEEDEKSKKKKDRLEKVYLNKAKNFFKEQSQKYKAPLESKGGDIPAEYKESYQKFQELQAEQKQQAEVDKKNRQQLLQATEKLFSESFKGFEFDLGEQKDTYSPQDLSAVKEANVSLKSFLGKFFNKDGTIKDVAGFHKAMTAAQDPDAIARHFYEKGRAEVIEGGAKGRKQVRSTMDASPAPSNKKVRPVDIDDPRLPKPSQNRLRMKHY